MEVHIGDFLIFIDLVKVFSYLLECFTVSDRSK